MTLNLAGLSDLLGLGQSVALSALLVFLRVGAAMALLPAFGEQSIPQRLRLVLALAFSAVVLPAAAPMMPAIRAFWQPSAKLSPVSPWGPCCAFLFWCFRSLG